MAKRRERRETGISKRDSGAFARCGYAGCAATLKGARLCRGCRAGAACRKCGRCRVCSGDAAKARG